MNGKPTAAFPLGEKKLRKFVRRNQWYLTFTLTSKAPKTADCYLTPANFPLRLAQGKWDLCWIYVEQCCHVELFLGQGWSFFCVGHVWPRMVCSFFGLVAAPFWCLWDLYDGSM